MSPGERVGNWRVRSPLSRASSSTATAKRKRDCGWDNLSTDRATKMQKMDGDGMEYEYEDTSMADEEEELAEDDGSDRMDYDDGRLRSPFQPESSTPRSMRYKSAWDDNEDEQDGTPGDHSVVVGEEAYYTPQKHRIVEFPETTSMRHLDTDALRAQGWDDDYITLIHRIALRGHEPLLPSYLHFEYKFLPDGLFEKDDDAFISSVKGEHFKASKALEKLIELGGRMRDRIETNSHITPEQQVKRQMKSYMNWAIEDAGLDKNTLIPILAMEFQPAKTGAAILKANALAKCKKLAYRYRNALRVRRTVEISPASRSSDGTILSYPLPTFYALLASHTILALMVYKPDSDHQELDSMALFDFKDRSYDVWNSLALAILVNHVRNVQVRIAEETGIGEKQYMRDEEIEKAISDPDA